MAPQLVRVDALAPTGLLGGRIAAPAGHFQAFSAPSRVAAVPSIAGGVEGELRQLAVLGLPTVAALKFNAGLPLPAVALGSLSLGDYLFPKLRLSTAKSWPETSVHASRGGWHSAGS